MSSLLVSVRLCEMIRFSGSSFPLSFWSVFEAHYPFRSYSYSVPKRQSLVVIVMLAFWVINSPLPHCYIQLVSHLLVNAFLHSFNWVGGHTPLARASVPSKLEICELLLAIFQRISWEAALQLKKNLTWIRWGRERSGLPPEHTTSRIRWVRTLVAFNWCHVWVCEDVSLSIVNQNLPLGVTGSYNKTNICLCSHLCVVLSGMHCGIFTRQVTSSIFHTFLVT